MTPLDFEAAYAPLWAELEAVIGVAETKRKFDGARLATLYRRVCEHLALAQARAYPIHLTQRLESLTQSAHRLIYRQHDYGLARFARLALVDFPEAVRAHRVYLWVSALMFVLPLLVAGWAAWRDPGFILHLLDADNVQQFDAMYSDDADAFGRTRSAGDDWQMFGFYVMHNIGIGFRCFAAGIFAGVGSAALVVFNGIQIGAVGGYLIGAGHAQNFLSFVVTHSAFELTAIVLAGAAGLRLGYAWIAPGRHTRLEALRLAARHAVVIVYGVIGLLLIAAAVEAFWSSARWIAPAVKYGVGGACWVLVLAYLGWQGRPRGGAEAAPERSLAVQVDGLAIALRPRPMAEAADLGAQLVRSHARSVWRTFLPVYLATVLLAFCTVEIAGWLPSLLIFWLKPWLDRSLLFVHSRAVFGQETRWADLWQNRRAVWGGQLLRTLVWRRLSPWRSFTQAIDQLEGQRGGARSKRRAQLLRGRRGAATGMQLVYANVEMALDICLLSLLFWFAPEGSARELFGWLTQSDAPLQSLLAAGAYAIVVGVLEPFYVGAGFAMYLNRRVELEAWDIEQEFRRGFR